MSYVDYINFMRSKMRRNFGNIKPGDVSVYESQLYNGVLAEIKKVAGRTPEQYYDALSNEMDAVNVKRGKPDEVFHELFQAGDREAIRLNHEYVDADNRMKEISPLLQNKNREIDTLNAKIKNELAPAEAAAKQAYDKKVAEINAKYKSDVEKAMKNYAGDVKKPEKNLMVMYPKKQEISEKLEILHGQIDAVVQQINSAVLVRDKYVKDSKEYNDCQALIDNLVKQEQELRNPEKKLREKYNDLKEDIAKDNGKLAQKNDKSNVKLEQLEQDKNKALADALTTYQKFQNALDEANRQKDTLEDQRWDLARRSNEAESAKANCYDACLNYARDVMNAKWNALVEKRTTYQKFNKIRTAITTKNQEISPEQFAKGLAMVKQCYMIYHNKHSNAARFFRWVPFTKARADYKAFSKLREDLHKTHGCTMKELNTYLDTNRMTGTLANNMNGYRIDVENLEINVNSDYSKMAGASVEAYSARMTDLAKKSLFTGMFTLGVNIAKMDEGFKMLNAMGDEARKAPENQALKTAITEISKTVRTFAGFGAYLKDIDDRIANALKPANERQEMPVNFISEAEKKGYEDYMSGQKAYHENELNAVLKEDVNVLPMVHPADPVVNIEKERAEQEAKRREEEEKANQAREEEERRAERQKQRERDQELEKLANDPELQKQAENRKLEEYRKQLEIEERELAKARQKYIIGEEPTEDDFVEVIAPEKKAEKQPEENELNMNK